MHAVRGRAHVACMVPWDVALCFSILSCPATSRECKEWSVCVTTGVTNLPCDKIFPVPAVCKA